MASSETLTEKAISMVEDIRIAAAAETRKDHAKALAQLAKGSVKALLATGAPATTDDFRAGLAFAAELLADENYDA